MVIFAPGQIDVMPNPDQNGPLPNIGSATLSYVKPSPLSSPDIANLPLAA